MSEPTTRPALMPKACEICGNKEGLLHCSHCRCVYYCGAEHQAADRRAHKADCKAVKGTQDMFSLVFRQNGGGQEGGQLLQPFLLITDETNAWPADNLNRLSLGLSLDFIRMRLARFGSVEANGGRPQKARAHVIEEALLIILYTIDNARSDDSCTRYAIPGFYLALGRDREAYNFLKWWGTEGAGWSYDIENAMAEYGPLQVSDAFEEPLGVWTTGLQSWSQPPLAHAVAVMLIKVRILLDLRAVKSARLAFKGTVPNELIDIICQHSAGTILTSRPDILRENDDGITERIKNIKVHIRRIYRSINRSNPLFWEMMLAGMRDMRGALGAVGSLEREAYYARKHSYTSWCTTPGVMDVVRSLRADSGN